MSLPNDVDLLRLIADTHAQHGLALAWESRQADAEMEMREASSIYEHLAASSPDDAAAQSGLWSSYWLTSSIYEEQNDELSHAFAVKALDVISRVVTLDPENVRARQQLAKSYSRLGQTATNTGRSAEAITHLGHATAILQDIVSGESRNGRLRSELALALTRLADARARAGQLEAALVDAQRAVDIYIDVTTHAPSDRRSWHNLVLTHESVGDIHERLGRAHPDTAGTHMELAAVSYRTAFDVLTRLRDEGSMPDFDDALLRTLTEKVGRLPAVTTATRQHAAER